MRLTARERLYPSAPSPGLPHTLLLQQYAGTYTHPAYPDFIIREQGDGQPGLRVVLSGSLNVTMNLKHVSGEYFVAEVFEYMCVPEPSAIVKAEFHIGVAGQVDRFGVIADFSDMPDTMIWFDRVV